MSAEDALNTSASSSLLLDTSFINDVFSGAAPAAVPRSNVSPSPSGPKFGGFHMRNFDYPWIGGKPELDFSGTTNLKPATILCCIPTDPSKYAKIYDGKTSMSIRAAFTGKDPEYPLQAFARDVWKHLEKYGLDTYFYFQDPATNQLVDIVNNFARFNKTLVANSITQASKPTGHYGSCQFALDALRDSGSYIYNSVSTSLQLRLQTCSTDPRLGDSGPVLWMTLVEELLSNSHQMYKQKVRALESITLAQFDGENVADFAHKMRDMIATLEAARQLPPDIVLTILNIFCSSTVEEFRVSFHAKRESVDEFLRSSQGKDLDAVKRLPGYISPYALLDTGVNLYRALYDTGRWGASKASANFAGKLNRSNRNRGEKPTGGKPSVESTPKDPTPAPTTPTTPSTPDDDRSAWKAIAPKKGEATTKKVGTVEWHWCAKCSHWRVNHDTSSHKDLPEKTEKKGPRASGNLARLSAITDSDEEWGFF